MERTMAGTAFSHQSICVSDRARSLKFYSEALGFTLSHSLDIGPECEGITELKGIKSAADFMTLGTMQIELLSYVSPATIGPATRRPMNQLGLTHLSFTVTSIAETMARIEACGGEVLASTRLATPQGDLIFCTDPDGVRIELWEKIDPA
jgi:predicted enzyme related to lactoylglutathione lyase